MMTKRFKKIVFSEVALLVFQFLLGMYINIFTNGPPSNTLENAVVTFHILVGTIILVIAAYLTIKTRKISEKTIQNSSRAGLVFVSFAYLGGLAFIFSNGNSIFSYIMAIAFVFAIVAYVFLAGILSIGKAL